MAGVGRVIVAAAFIMSSVFFSFLLAPDRVSKEFGLLLGVAILTDALIVRMTLVPALLTVLGERSWTIPRWLDKVLPNITIEPPAEREDGGVRARAARAGRVAGGLAEARGLAPPDGRGQCPDPTPSRTGGRRRPAAASGRSARRGRSASARRAASRAG